ncbi:MAG: glutathione S-transferase family protein [Desulfobacterales bacterium]|nr:glutathione S-transferase family protein [Desulfobacterales bacterium]
MVNIYGSKMTSAFRCHVLAKEIGLEYEEVSVDLGNPVEDYLKLNPNGKVPCLVDGDFVLWESMAITAYLAGKYKPELLGSSVEERALIDQWSYWAILELQPDMFKVIVQIFTPEDKRDIDIIKTGTASMKPKHRILDDYLKGRDYMVGDKFTLADINVGSVAIVNRLIGNDLSEFPNLEKWLNMLGKRPSFR